MDKVQQINDAPHCQHFVVRKKRFCRMTIRMGAKYCGEHEQNESKTIETEESRKRITCPLDPKHTCFVSKLSKHLKICNARHADQPAYIVKGCNFNNVDSLVVDAEAEVYPSLSAVPTEEVQIIIRKINDLYNLLVQGNIHKFEHGAPHNAVKAEIENEKRGNNTKKHLLQNSSLLQLLEEYKLIDENTCFVELGAGKGHLSYFLSQLISNMKTSSVLLVDKRSHRHKQDNKIDKETHIVHRIRADICDLQLSKVEVVSEAKKVVAVSKHLCGMATDLAIRCITSDEIKDKTRGVLMATCCHHRCDYHAYIAKDFLEKYGIGSKAFSIFCGVVSWATCGTGFSRDRRHEMTNNTDDPKRIKIHDSGDNSGNELHNNSTSSSNKLGLNFIERAEVGRKAKAILDWGRMQFLISKGFNASLWHYVDSEVSPENVCLIASRNV